jgi:hypothetical protein
MRSIFRNNAELTPFLLLLLVLLAISGLQCGGEKPETKLTLEEAKKQALEAMESAEIMLQGARPGTDLSDARELLDQAQQLYDRASTVEELVGEEDSVLQLVEEAKRRARRAMEAEKL